MFSFVHTLFRTFFRKFFKVDELDTRTHTHIYTHVCLYREQGTQARRSNPRRNLWLFIRGWKSCRTRPEFLATPRCYYSLSQRFSTWAAFVKIPCNTPIQKFYYISKIFFFFFNINLQDWSHFELCSLNKFASFGMFFRNVNFNFLIEFLKLGKGLNFESKRNNGIFWIEIMESFQGKVENRVAQSDTFNSPFKFFSIRCSRSPPRRVYWKFRENISLAIKLALKRGRK